MQFLIFLLTTWAWYPLCRRFPRKLGTEPACASKRCHFFFIAAAFESVERIPRFFRKTKIFQDEFVRDRIRRRLLLLAGRRHQICRTQKGPRNASTSRMVDIYPRRTPLSSSREASRIASRDRRPDMPKKGEEEDDRWRREVQNKRERSSIKANIYAPSWCKQTSW